MTPLRWSPSTTVLRSVGVVALGLLAFPGLGAQSLPGPSDVDAVDQDVVDGEFSDQVPGHLAIVDGAASLEREGQKIRAAENEPLFTGDRLRTDIGRVEVQFEDGSRIDFDERTDLDFLSDALVRLHRGRIRLVLAKGSTTPTYRIDAAGTSTEIRAAGEYLISLPQPDSTPAQVRVTVVRGLADLATPTGHTLIHAGNEAVAEPDLAPSLPYTVTTAVWDAFYRWTQDLDLTHAPRDEESAQYLPPEVVPYSATLDQYGSWGYYQPYGYVWYPRVAAGWRPYSVGRWAVAAHYGWFWIGTDRWSWPTHHYGRWGVADNRWFWIPDHRWSPAWVSWASAPGYVSWCPLGYDNHPVYPFSMTSYHTWNSWTVVPVAVFTPNVVVTRYAVRDHSVLTAHNLRFESGRNAPPPPAAAVASGRPVRAPGAEARAAMPRTARPVPGMSTAVRGRSDTSWAEGMVQAAGTRLPAQPSTSSRSASASSTAGRSAIAADSLAASSGTSRAVPRTGSRSSSAAATNTGGADRRSTQSALEDWSRQNGDARTPVLRAMPSSGAVIQSAPGDGARAADRRPGEAPLPVIIRRAPNTPAPPPAPDSPATWRLRTAQPQSPAASAPESRAAAPRSETADSGWSRPNPSRARESAPTPAPGSSPPPASPSVRSTQPSQPGQPSQPAPDHGAGAGRAVPRGGR